MTSTTKNPILTLIKYNCRFIYKQLIVFYCIIFGLTLLYCLTNFETSNFWIRLLHEFSQGATFGFALGMLINASLRMWAKYRYGVYGDESYLIHTLPLRRTTIWAANFLTSIIVLLISGIVLLVCALVVLPISECTLMLSDHNINFWVLFAILCFSVFCQAIFIMQAGLTGINFGHLHNNNPVAHSVIYSIIIYLVGGILIVSICVLISQFDPTLQRILNGNFQSGQDLYQLFMVIDILYLGLIIATYFINRTLLNRGVNVD